MLPSMTVMAREAWTDERLDDLSKRMEQGFGRVEADIREVRMEMKTGFDSIAARFDVINVRIDSLQRTLVVGFVTMTASIVAAVLGAAVIG
jgi:hypothetical protein